MKKVLLTNWHQLLRLNFAKKEHFTFDDWKKIILFDWKKLHKITLDGNQWVKKTKARSLQMGRPIKPSLKFVGGSLWISGFITSEGVGKVLSVVRALQFWRKDFSFYLSR